jgi:galactokinase
MTEGELQNKSALIHSFKVLFNTAPLVVRSPARINLIGEHTDYNLGFVLPAAVNKFIYVAMQKRDDFKLHFYADEFKDDYRASIEGKLESSNKLWPDYLLGVLDEFKKRGHTLTGISAYITGNIPKGAGLSSSAALECAFAYGINELFKLGYSRMELAGIARAAENYFVGVKCGIMDQFASIFGKNNNLIKLDCRSLTFDYVPFSASDTALVLFDTRIKHSLASSAYNKRREECLTGVELVKKRVPMVNSLRDVTEDMLLKYVYPIDQTIYRRCQYVVSENKRVEKACDDLISNDLISFGSRMYQTHEGLRDLYEVSCYELDLLVDIVKTHDAVLGARMMGGGFGGCTINLIKKEQVNRIIDSVCKAYESRTGLHLRIYPVVITNGTEKMKS